MYIVTLGRLNRGLARVIGELDSHGFWDDRLAAVDVYLVPLGVAYGWCWSGASGNICIPAVGLARLGRLLGREYVGLADVLRHEYGHALPNTHRGLTRCREFRAAFGGSIDCDRQIYEYDPHFHFTPYSAENPGEDFAEVFMFFLRHKGRLPRGHLTGCKKAKWGFITRLAAAVRRGKRHW